ncbi:MAG: hypothetical protein ACQET1_06765 [Gemmatimonadota bacterium]
MLEQLVGAFAWLAANGLYIDMKRKGKSGFARIIFFWMGIPATWLWLLLISEEEKPSLPPAGEDDFDEILEEIRNEKALGPGEEEATPPGSPPFP